jgi:hypothetical protein
MSNWPPPFARHRRLRLRFMVGALSLIALFALSPAYGVGVLPSVGSITYQIPSSIPGDCSADVTQPILSWIASVPNNSTLSFSTGACYRIEGTLEIRNRSGIDFEGNGATFRSFNAPADQRAIWRVIDSSGFVFNNMRIIGSYANGGTFNSSLQHAPAIDLRGTSADIGNATMSDLAGDCVYLGLGYTSALNRSSGSVHDSSCLRTSRSAVSLTAANDVTVTRVTTDRIGLSVFNVEPNIGPGWGAQRATFDHNTIGSYYLYAFAIIESAPVTDQAFTNNTVSGRGLRIGVVDPGSQGIRPQNVTITGNTSNSAEPPAAIEVHNVDTLTVTGNTIPLTNGTMTSVDNTCYVSVSANSYPGGTSQLTVNNAPTSCATSAPTTSPTGSAPTLSSFSPGSGSPGAAVTISGSNLTGATAVTFNGAAAVFTVNSASQITSTVPNGATSGPINVTTPGGTATSSASFTVTVPTPTITTPTISSFSPGSGSPGTAVTISGSNLTGATAVTFDGTAASFTATSGSEITAVVPNGATSGSISITTPTGTATSAKHFRVTNTNTNNGNASPKKR